MLWTRQHPNDISKTVLLTLSLMSKTFTTRISRHLLNEHSEQARAPHTNGPRDVPRCGALSLLQKTLHYKGGMMVVLMQLFAAALVVHRRCLIVCQQEKNNSSVVQQSRVNIALSVQ